MPHYLCTLLLFFSSIFSFENVFSQTEYRINLSDPGIRIAPKHYFIKEVLDRRSKPNNNGKILSASGNPVPVTFEKKAGAELFQYASLKMSSDTNLVPLTFVIEKLNYTDIGSVSRHTLTLTAKFSILRIVEGEEFVLYGTNGSPNYLSKGISTGLAEELLKQTLDQLFSGFDNWVNENPDQQPLCKSTEVIFAYDDSYTDYEAGDTIRWKSSYKLRWEDFQGKADKSSSFSAQSNCMFSFETIAEYKSGVLRLSLFIYPCFTKKASWVVPENKQDGLLNHEQFHFNICELYIRKLRKSIEETELTLLHPNEQIRDKFDQAWNDYQTSQALYDSETKHGIIEPMQKKWEENVNKELAELESYATRE